MRKSLWLTLALFLAAAVGMPSVLRADTTYNVVLDTANVSGTITTDGNTGVLGQSDIVSWDLTVNDGTDGPFTDTSADSNILVVAGDDLSATATTLSFAFTGGETGGLALDDLATSYAVCWVDDIYCDGEGTTNGITIQQQSGTFNYFSLDESGTQVIASATPPVSTPEPGTVALLLMGIGMVLVMRKRLDLSFNRAA